MTIRTYKMLGFFLAYPEAELKKYYDDMVTVLRDEAVLSAKKIDAIEKLVDHLKDKNLLDIQEEYVELFDRTPSLSLHLFEHVHGDSRDRGQAMVDLQALYLEEGLEIDVRETPDYLPMFLEYLTVLPFEESRQCLAEVVNVLTVLRKRLEKRETLYVTLFEALEELSQAKPDMKIIEQALETADGHAASQTEMDAAWEEQFAFDQNMSADSGCPMAQRAVDEMLAKIDKKEA